MNAPARPLPTLRLGRRPVAKLFLMLAMLLGMVGIASANAAPAAAGTSCDAVVYCGRIANSSYSDTSLPIYRDWGTSGPTSSSPRAYLSPGTSSTRYWADTDGFRVPYGYTAKLYSPGSSRATYHGGGSYVKVTNAIGTWVVNLTRN